MSEIEFLTGWYITYIMFLCSRLRQLDLRTAGTKLKLDKAKLKLDTMSMIGTIVTRLCPLAPPIGLSVL